MSQNKALLLPFIFIFSFIIVCVYQTKAQQINNLKVQKLNDEIIISFDLKAINNPQEMYDINIYSSNDEYATALELKEGIQKDIFPKLNIRYTIDAKKTFSGFEGSVDFKVVATLSFMPIAFVYPTESMKTKVGKSVEVMWKGGGSNDTYKLEYSNDGGTWSTLENEIHDNKYTWFIPRKSKKGTYAMKLTSTEPRAKAAFSGNIVVKKKTSPFVFIIPIVAIGAGAYFFLLPKDNSSETPTDNSLPGPPVPPGSSLSLSF